MISPTDESALKLLIPHNSLNQESLRKLIAKTDIKEVAAGEAIFNQSDTDRNAVYLLTGMVNLTDEKGKVKVIEAGSDIAKHPLANQQPRKESAVAKTDSRIAFVDSNLLDVLLTWDQLSGVEVDEISGDEGAGGEDGGDDCWMTRILQSKAFLQVPPANIQSLFMRVQEVPAKAGEVIIKKGDEGDYYYIIKKGKCKVTRNTKTGSEVVLNSLNEGDVFGEDALLSDAKRNANVVMTTNGSLMRLAKKDFNMLLREPMLQWVTFDQANALVKKGAMWLDVRLESEHKSSRPLPGSLNIPLFMLRMKADALDTSKKYILYCDSGRRASAGAFILNKIGLDAYCLKCKMA